jgi:GR25 family glycosyltransferase involved in LPS biosynthesis
MWKFIIISVKEDVDRRTHVTTLKEKLESYGYETEIMDGIYWKTQNVLEILDTLNITVTNLSQSQIACFLSHRLA